jgi:hypothetical protein
MLPNLLRADKGLEYGNKHFKSLLNNYGINTYHTQNLEKSVNVERFNRTLNNKTKILFEVRSNKIGSIFYTIYWMNTTLKISTDLLG